MSIIFESLLPQAVARTILVNETLDYHFSTTSKNWVHMTVKPQDLLDEEEAAKKVKESSSHGGRSGCCVIL